MYDISCIVADLPRNAYTIIVANQMKTNKQKSHDYFDCFRRLYPTPISCFIKKIFKLPAQFIVTDFECKDHVFIGYL